MTTRSAASIDGASGQPAASSRPAISSESLRFIWQPSVQTKNDGRRPDLRAELGEAGVVGHERGPAGPGGCAGRDEVEDGERSGRHAGEIVAGPPGAAWMRPWCGHGRRERRPGFARSPRAGSPRGRPASPGARASRRRARGRRGSRSRPSRRGRGGSPRRTSPSGSRRRTSGGGSPGRRGPRPSGPAAAGSGRGPRGSAPATPGRRRRGSPGSPRPGPSRSAARSPGWPWPRIRPKASSTLPAKPAATSARASVGRPSASSLSRTAGSSWRVHGRADLAQALHGGREPGAAGAALGRDRRLEGIVRGVHADAQDVELALRQVEAEAARSPR